MHPVESALELEDLVTPSVGPGDPEAVVGRLGAGRGEADLLRAGDSVNQALSELDGVGVLCEKGGALSHGFLGGCHDLGVGVAEDHGP